MSRNWTREQKLAIETVGVDVLASASAGTGKTAVLSERCVHLAADGPDRCRLDEVLVLTFTEPAAAEMRRRIGDSLRRRLIEKPGDGHLRRQFALLDRAQISTVHAFCRGVLREYFYRAGIDPEFDILDADDAELLRSQIAEAILEEHYGGRGGETQGRAFAGFVQRYREGRDEQSLTRLVVGMHNFLESTADQRRWVESLQNHVRQSAGRTIGDGAAGREVGDDAAGRAIGADAVAGNWPRLAGRQQAILLQRLDRAIEQVRFASALTKYYPEEGGSYAQYLGDELPNRLREFREYVRALSPFGATMIGEPEWPKAPSVRGAKDLSERPLKAMIDAAKKQCFEAIERYSTTAGETVRQLGAVGPHVEMLIGLHDEFQRRYGDLKRRVGGLDFGDLEHACLRLLSGDTAVADSSGEAGATSDSSGKAWATSDSSGETGMMAASEAARELQRRYKHILVDEYQDISPVQERILTLICRGGKSWGKSDGKAKANSDGKTEMTAGGELREKSGGKTDEPSSGHGGGAVFGNVFMVGDAKQSIYGFRRADCRIILEKYREYRLIGDGAQTSVGHSGDSPAGVRIDLRDNFRSRRTVIEGVNYLFGRMMTESFGGIGYDERAALRYAAQCYSDSDEDGGQAPHRGPGAVELHLIEREANISRGDDDDNSESESGEADAIDLESLRREALAVAERIRKMVGEGGKRHAENAKGRQAGRQSEFDIYDQATGGYRGVRYGDIVVLLRSMQHKAAVWSEVFARAGIPTHVELTTGYFAATEIQDMLSLLSIIDNYQQDIPLAAVLRSPLVGLTETDMTKIRLHSREVSYHQAVIAYGHDGEDAAVRGRVREFLDRIEQWRQTAREGRLSRVVWRIYRQTGLTAMVRGMSDGRQRYRNLLLLYEHARRFDSFSRQGLGRFLRFVEKLRNEEGDFGPASVVTEAENVVRIMSIHRSKGLEFPVVIAANLAGQFNMTDSRKSILFGHDDPAGMGLKVVDPASGDRWATTAYSLIADEARQRSLAEEMRILYVAMTRAREKLVLTASVPLEKSREAWRMWGHEPTAALPEFYLSNAKNMIDWVGAAMAGHGDFADFLKGDLSPKSDRQAVDKQSLFKIETWDHNRIAEAIESSGWRKGRSRELFTLEALRKQRSSNDENHTQDGDHIQNDNRLQDNNHLQDDAPVQGNDRIRSNDRVQKVLDRVRWRYGHQALTKLAAQQSVSEIKRAADRETEDDFAKAAPLMAFDAELAAPPTDRQRRIGYSDAFSELPDFLAERREGTRIVTAADKGTWSHTLMERLDLAGRLDGAGIREQLGRLIDAAVFTTGQAEQIDIEAAARFFAGPVGREIIAHRANVRREWFFTLGVRAAEVYRRTEFAGCDGGEAVVVRGIIDCWYEKPEGVVIVDYKTDQVSGEHIAERAEYYRVQIELYRQAIERITGKQVSRSYLSFLSPGIDYEIQ